MDIRIATRKSELALWQARHVASRLESLTEVSSVTLVPLSTRGDEVLDRSLQKIGGKGLFIKELEVAMQDDRADIAVHSMKDVPAEMPEGFCIAAMLARANPADALVSREGQAFTGLPSGARIGSSSLRRQAQLKAKRQDIDVIPLRGNVNTRLAKLDAGDYDAIVLACAGLERLGLASRITEAFDADTMLPAAAQGVIGIECLDGRTELIDVLSQLTDTESDRTTRAERAVAMTLGADCHSPVASYATVDNDTLTLTALVASDDGRTIIRERQSGPASDADSIGLAVAEALLDGGARDLLAGSST